MARRGWGHTFCQCDSVGLIIKMILDCELCETKAGTASSTWHYLGKCTVNKKAGAKQAFLANLTSCEFVLKKKSKKLVEHLSSRIVLEIDRVYLKHRATLTFWLPTASFNFFFSLCLPPSSSRGRQHPIPRRVAALRGFCTEC